MRYGQLFIDVGDITKEVRINWSSVVLKWWQIVEDIHTLYVLYVYWKVVMSLTIINDFSH